MTQSKITASLSVFSLKVWFLQCHLALASHLCTLLPIEPPQGMTSCWHKHPPPPPQKNPTTQRDVPMLASFLLNVTTMCFGFGLLWSAGTGPSVIDRLTSVVVWQHCVAPLSSLLFLYCSGQQDTDESVHLQAAETGGEEIQTRLHIHVARFYFSLPITNTISIRFRLEGDGYMQLFLLTLQTYFMACWQWNRSPLFSQIGSARMGCTDHHSALHSILQQQTGWDVFENNYLHNEFLSFCFMMCAL